MRELKPHSIRGARPRRAQIDNHPTKLLPFSASLANTVLDFLYVHALFYFFIFFKGVMGM